MLSKVGKWSIGKISEGVPDFSAPWQNDKIAHAIYTPNIGHMQLSTSYPMSRKVYIDFQISSLLEVDIDSPMIP